MAIEIRVPALGESITEATIGQWFKKPGDSVAEDETLCELETDKVTVEVPAPVAGVLGDIQAEEGATVEVGAVLGAIQNGAATPAKSAKPKEPEPEAKKPAPEKAPAPQAKPNGDMPPSPAARKQLEETGLDAAEVQGSGKRGQVLKEDVLKALETGISAPVTPTPPPAARAPSSTDDAPREERVRMTKLRQTIARRLKEAQNTAAMLTTYNEVDMTNLLACRNQYKDGFEKKHGVKLGFMSFFIKACTTALNEWPAVNAEIDGNSFIYKNYCDIGVAVGTPQGLVVPVIRSAEKKSFADLESTIVDFGKRARDGKLGMDEMTGGSFTISNGGVFGSLLSSPILNAPQSGILGMHKTQMRPVAIDGKVEIRPMMYLALSYDHRIIDGREAVSFLVRVKECIENPERILLDI